MNAERLDLGLLAYIAVSVDRTTKGVFSEFPSAMRALAEVLECYLIAGEFDYLLKVRTHDVKGFRQFLCERLSPACAEIVLAGLVIAARTAWADAQAARKRPPGACREFTEARIVIQLEGTGAKAGPVLV